MLIDPDSPLDDWQTEVKAADLSEARALCEEIMATADYPIELADVSQRTKTRKEGKYKFVCWFRVEDQDGYSSSSSSSFDNSGD
jgi:hypothetical protein